MPIFTVTGDVDPFLHVSLRKGETIFCESDAMVMMEAPLDLTGSMQGGLVRAAMRRLANGESFFQQRIEAKRGDGDCLLAPNMPGGMQVLDVGARQYRMSDGAYVAATERIEVNARMQSLGNALFGGTGGFFIGETQGDGQVVVGGFGSLFTLDVAPGKDIVIDNGRVGQHAALRNRGVHLAESGPSEKPHQQCHQWRRRRAALLRARAGNRLFA